MKTSGFTLIELSIVLVIIGLPPMPPAPVDNEGVAGKSVPEFSM
jgi:prepilin-type N-terminal cleavage/methylation domain-containing protein